MREAPKKLTIGRLEKVSFPNLNLQDIDAKIDTGAYSSAIHCHDIQVSDNDILTVRLLDPGHIQKRFKIKTTVVLGNKKVKTVFTLTDRSKMKYPVLLGRKFLRNRFIVDVASTYIFQPKNK